MKHIFRSSVFLVFFCFIRIRSFKPVYWRIIWLLMFFCIIRIKSFKLVYSKMTRLLEKLDDILAVEAGLILRICDKPYFVTFTFSKVSCLQMYMGHRLWNIFCICTMQTFEAFSQSMLINFFIQKSLNSLLGSKATVIITMFFHWKNTTDVRIQQIFLWTWWTAIWQTQTLSCTNMKEYCWWNCHLLFFFFFYEDNIQYICKKN